MNAAPALSIDAVRRHAQRGFTLLEMVIAISIFAVVGAVSYTSLDQFLATRDLVDARNAATRQLQRAIGHFERDVRFMTRRTVRDGIGETLPAMLGGDADAIGDAVLIEMTVAQPSYRNPRWHRVRRISWSLVDGRIVRQVWPVLDRDFDSVPRETALLDGVRSASIRYYARASGQREVESRTQWGEDDGDELPLAVELILTLDDETTYRRLIEVANVSNRT